MFPEEGSVEKSLSYQARREVLQQIVPQYRQASPAQKRTLLEAFTCPNTPGGSSTMLKRYSRHMGIYSYADVDRKSDTRWSSPGTPPIASAPSASSPCSLHRWRVMSTSRSHSSATGNGFVLAPGGHMLTPLLYGSPQASTHASFRLSPCFSACPWQLGREPSWSWSFLWPG